MEVRSLPPEPSSSEPLAVLVFSGIKPTGDPTLGNYSGGFRQYAATQELGEAFFCIVDLHAITVEHELARVVLPQHRPHQRG